MRRFFFKLIILLALAGCVTTGGPRHVDKSKMAEGYYMRGLSYLQEKDYENASVEFNRSIQTDSSYKQSYYGLGIISDYQGKLDSSQKYYEKAIDLDPKYSEAYNSLGVVFAKQKKWKYAIKSFQKALSNKLYTTPHVPYLNMGDVYMEQKEYAKAADAYRESKRFVVLDITVYKLGTALLEGGNTTEAIKTFLEGVGMSPQNADMRYSLALAYLKAGNKRAARSAFRKVTELAPKSELSLKAKDYINSLR